MRALSVEQRIAAAYIAGVIAGDGWCSENAIGLKAADRDFVESFIDALAVACEVEPNVRCEENKYWLTNLSNASGRFNFLNAFEPETLKEKGQWVRGFFDSDGNANLTPSNNSSNAWSRRVAIYKTERFKLERAKMLLSELGIPSRLRATKAHLQESHFGDQVVYELRLKSSKKNYRRFATLVGSSIARKREILEAIPESYAKPGFERRAQAKGAATKRRKRKKVTIPRVIGEMATMIEAGIKPTIRICTKEIVGYWSARGEYRHLELVEMAKEQAEI